MADLAAAAPAVPEPPRSGPVRSLNPHVALFRQAVTEKNNAVHAYALRSAVATADGGWFAEDEVEHLVEEEYARLDLLEIGGDRPVILRATRRLLAGETVLPASPHGLMLEVGAALARDADVRHRAAALRSRGVELVVGDYAATPEQDELVPMAWAVKVDVRTEPDVLRDLAHHAHAQRARVVAEGATSPGVQRRALTAGADLLQGPMINRVPDGPVRKARAGEMQCLEVISLLSAPEIDLEAIQRMVAADPQLSIRVLHVVNSSAFALQHTVDSLRHAVVLLGPHRLAALAMASLIDARPTAIGPLWAVLTRALTCRELTGEDAGYTVGLLSAVASQQRIAIESLLATSGVSPEVALALEIHTGPLGTALAAVIAHEENDTAAMVATGLDPAVVARAYLDAVPQALSTATALSVDPVS